MSRKLASGISLAVMVAAFAVLPVRPAGAGFASHTGSLQWQLISSVEWGEGVRIGFHMPCAVSECGIPHHGGLLSWPLLVLQIAVGLAICIAAHWVAGRTRSAAGH